MRHPLFPTALLLAAGLAVLCLLVVAADALVAAWQRHRAARRRGAGVYGAVVDATGRVLGTYLDPFAREPRRARVHDEGSPWTAPAPGGRRGWAWEGFGETPEEARLDADRLRLRHLRLFPWLAGREEEEDEDAGEAWKG